ncbi:MAG: glycosyltransferase family 2 protein [Planctomycetes bacterium]|nr:glycosyltransferase family 2 protein [Planctomycetota bacterium]
MNAAALRPIAEFAFFICAVLIVYTYVLFPALVLLWSVVRRRRFVRGDEIPSVSLIIVGYNEAGAIGERIENALALEFPRDRLEVIVASDGSTDAMVQIARRFEPQGVRVLECPRRGKHAALNDAVDMASGEILAFSDAHSHFAPDALATLVRPFADPEVGCVAGNRVYMKRHRAAQPRRTAGQAATESSAARPEAGTAAGERLYWSFDRILKLAETFTGSAISASGAIYALRRTLFRPVPPGVTDDFITSTQVVAQGYRLVFEPTAVAFEIVDGSSRHEFARKVRVITRGLRGVLTMRRLLNPFRYGFYSLELLSHKVLRRLMVFPLCGLLASSALLWPAGTFYRAVAVAQLAGWLIASMGLWLSKTRAGRLRLLALPAYFLLVNAASFLAAVNVARGRSFVVWDPGRTQSGRVERKLAT